MFRQYQVGLDIGINKVKIISLAQKWREVELLRFGSIDIQSGSVEAGTVLDPIQLGNDVKNLVDEMGLNGRKAILTVPGHQVYMRTITMPGLKSNELKTAVYYKASEFLPIPIQETVMDIFPYHSSKYNSNKRAEVFLAAVRQQHLDNLVSTCRQAGLKPTAVEIEPLSWLRAWGGKSDGSIGLVAFGSHRPYLAVFYQGIPVFYRSLAINRNEYIPDNHWDYPVITDDPPSVTDILDEIRNSLRFYENQNDRPGGVDRLVVCGGSIIPNSKDSLEKELGLEVEWLEDNAWNQIRLPSWLDDENHLTLKKDFSLALGLAKRGLSI